MRVAQLGCDVEAELVTILNGGISQPNALNSCNDTLLSMSRACCLSNSSHDQAVCAEGQCNCAKTNGRLSF